MQTLCIINEIVIKYILLFPYNEYYLNILPVFLDLDVLTI
jgi:hypothetical protein